MTRQVCFAWPGLPIYAARCIAAFIRQAPALEVSVVATRSRLPIDGVEDSLGRPVHWIEPERRNLRWADLGLSVPDLFVQCSYSTRSFLSLGAEVRRRGGSVALGSDHNWRGSARQAVIDPVRHLLQFRHQYRWVLVPGRSGTVYHRRMGYGDDRIVQGLLGADPALFGAAIPLAERPKDLIFVGQLIKRKNVLRLLRAFEPLAAADPEWRLHICGSGPLRDRVRSGPNVLVHEFLQPPEVARLMGAARALVLPSLEEHWGLVVHEAALSGCALLLSSCIGAADDLAEDANAILFDPRSTAGISAALSEFAGWGPDRLVAAGATSASLARRFGPRPFAEAVSGLVGQLGHGR